MKDPVGRKRILPILERFTYGLIGVMPVTSPGQGGTYKDLRSWFSLELGIL